MAETIDMSFYVVSPWIMIKGMETTISYLFFYHRSMLFRYEQKTQRNHHLEMELASDLSSQKPGKRVSLYFSVLCCR